MKWKIFYIEILLNRWKMSKKVIAVIPARYGSTRFPGKPLAKINHKEMILWVAEAVRKSDLVSEIIIATDHQGIYDLVTKNHFTAVMTDPNLPSGTDRMWAAIRKESFDIAVNVQGDEPLLKHAHLELLIKSLIEDSECEMSTLAQPLVMSAGTNELENLNSVKVIVNQKNHAIYFSRFAIPYSRVEHSKGSQLAYKHIGLYAYKKEFLERFCSTPVCELEKAESLEQLRALYLGAKIKVVKVSDAGWGVDTPEDLIKIDKLLNS